MPSVVINVNDVKLRDVEDENRPSFDFGTIEMDGRQLEIKFKGVTGCRELGLGSNEVDLDLVSVTVNGIQPRSFKRSVEKILRLASFFLQNKYLRFINSSIFQNKETELQPRLVCE